MPRRKSLSRYTPGEPRTIVTQERNASSQATEWKIDIKLQTRDQFHSHQSVARYWNI